MTAPNPASPGQVPRRSRSRTLLRKSFNHAARPVWELFAFIMRMLREAGLKKPDILLFQLVVFAAPTALAMLLMDASLALALGANLAWFLLLRTVFKLGLRGGAEARGWAIVFYIFTGVPAVLLLTFVLKQLGYG